MSTKEKVRTKDVVTTEIDKRIQSGWMDKAITGYWIGCGSPDELHEVWMSMQDEAAQEKGQFPGKLVMTPATVEEVEIFKGEAGDPWPDLVIRVGEWHYYKSDVPQGE